MMADFGRAHPDWKIPGANCLDPAMPGVYEHRSSSGDRQPAPSSARSSGRETTRWLRDEEHTGPVGIEALGLSDKSYRIGNRRSGKSSDRLFNRPQSDSSLKDVIEQNQTMQDNPEALCFGLLKSFDVPDLIWLMAPRPLSVIKPDVRLTDELAALNAYYAAMGVRLESTPS